MDLKRFRKDDWGRDTDWNGEKELNIIIKLDWKRLCLTDCEKERLIGVEKKTAHVGWISIDFTV